MPAITAQKLVREFGAGTRAVDGIDLEVFPGEIYGFLGPNGAGVPRRHRSPASSRETQRSSSSGTSSTARKGIKWSPGGEKVLWQDLFY